MAKSDFLKNKYLLILVTLVSGLPIIFIVSMYLISQNTKLEGPRGGPQDAFRHTYTSAIVARYLSPRLVRIATSITENDPESAYDIMDIHNNTLGIQIGLSTENIYFSVLNKIKDAEIKTRDSDRIYILEPSKWKNSDIF